MELKHMNSHEIEQVNGLCGYIRNPDYFKKYVIGTCALTGRRCESDLPQIMKDCKIYKKRFK